ncbi:MAG: ribonuclease catalytic domain-containing protein, partial [Candidatus Eremiobacterota bacterium]
MLNSTSPIGFTAPLEAGRKNRRREEHHQGDRVSRGHQPPEIYGSRRGRRKWAQNRQTGQEAAVGVTSGMGGLPAGVAAANARLGITDLRVLADRKMEEMGLATEISREAQAQVMSIQAPARAGDDPSIRDLTRLNWCSIDNGEGEHVSSKDLDQLTASEDLGKGRTRVWVAIADVDALMPKDSLADRQAQHNTTTVYTADKIYPMIHPHLSEDLTSMNPNETRLAMVTEMIIGPDGEVESFDNYRASVRSKVKLNYEKTGAWLEEKGERPRALDGLDEVAQGIQQQSDAAQRIKEARRRAGSLSLESQEAKAKMQDGKVSDLKLHQKNEATELIENLMVASNGCASKKLK